MAPDHDLRPAKTWLNRTVVGAGVASFLADVGYEMAAAALPNFLLALSPAAAPTALGAIEGTADAVANFAKLGTGYVGDRIGKRKPFVVAGYAITGICHLFWAFASSWPLVFLGKVVGWFGKGVRGPLRNAILADAVSAADRGKAFGLHRAADTAGAVVGPLLGAALLAFLTPLWPDDATRPFRAVFLLTVIPGLGSALAFAILVREKPIERPPERKFFAALGALPVPFRRYLLAVGAFGLGDCSRLLLILAASELLAPQLGGGTAAWAMVLYAFHNACQASISYPVGALSDRVGRRGLLIAGYTLGAAVSAGFALALFAETASVALVTLLLALSGTYVGIQESLESAMTADLVPDSSSRGTAYGVLGAVNGTGDLAASLIVGSLWLIAPPLGFIVAAGLMGLGAILLWRVQ
jgi:MFS family permease